MKTTKLKKTITLPEPTFKFSIKFKFAIIIIAAIILSCTTIAFFFVTRTRIELTNELDKRGFSEAFNLAYDANYGIMTEDSVILAHLIEGRMKKQDIVYVIITREDGLILADNNEHAYDISTKNKTNVQTEDNLLSKTVFLTGDNDEIYEFSAPVVTDDPIYDKYEDTITDDISLLSSDAKNTEQHLPIRGFVKIGFSIESIHKKVTNTLYTSVALIFVVISITIAVSYHFLTLIVNPIRNMAQVAREITMGNLTKKVDVLTPNDEVGVMAINFNKMTETLNSTIMELERLKSNLELKVEMRTRDLKLANIKLKHSNQELKSLNEKEADFIFTISHDFRTPLTSIIGYGKTLSESIREEIICNLDKLDLDNKEHEAFKSEMYDTQEGLDIIVSEGERLARLINKLLDLAKLESYTFEWNDNEVSLSELLNSALSGTSYLIKEKDLNVTVNGSGNIPDIYCDRDRMMQVLVNLLSNAIKFTYKGGQIDCSIHYNEKEDEVACSITDSGIGITKEDLSDIFLKFKRGKSKSSGTGLGLAICKEIVTHYGGQIWAESEYEKGSTFSFTMPTANKTS